MNPSLHVEIIGQGKPLILLHGWGWHSGIWQPLIPHLTEKFQLFLLDLPGFGKSHDHSANYFLPDISAAILKVVPPKAHWLGWSLGGMIAWHIAIHFPERVERLITVASSPKFLQAEHWPGVDPVVLAKFARHLQQDQRKTLLDFLELQLRGSPHHASLLAQLKPIFLQTEFATNVLQASLKLLQQIDLRADLQNMVMPSLHIFGSHDTLVPNDIADKIKPLLSQGEYSIIQKSGHLPFLSHQEHFLTVLQDFLNRAATVRECHVS